MATVQVLLSRRETLLTVLGRAEDFLAGYDAGRDQAQVPLRLSHIDNVWASLETVQGSLEDASTTAEGRALHADVRADFENRLFSIKATLLSYLPPPPTSLNAHNPCSANANSALSGIKLPTISLPEFDGNYEQWLVFHDTFVALIHSNADVPDIQKFHYLKAAVKGEAAQVIESISISSANYNLAWEALKGRYSNEYLMKKRHLQALFDVPRMKKESASALHALVDAFERHIKILCQLGEPTDSWSSILEHLLCTRLHDDTLKAWEDHASTVQDPNYSCLIEFLQRRIRVLESISVNHHVPSGNATPTSSSPSKKPTINLSSCSSTTSTSKRCPACNKPHPLGRCFKFQRLPLSERQQIVNAKRLCLNCFKADHVVRNCPSELNCRHCNRQHHALLHSGASDTGRKQSSENSSVASTSSSASLVQSRSPSQPESSEQSMVASSEVVPEVETSVPVQQPRENVFLLTVIVNIVDAFGQEHPARALLDSASQPNLITERMVRILRLRRSNVNITVQGAGKLSKTVRESVYTEVRSKNQEFSCGVNFLVMDKVTADLPSQNIPTSGWRIPKDLVLADPSFNKSQPIDLVLGAKHFYSFFPSAARLQLAANLPVLVDSVFGWIVAGSVNQNHPAGSSSATTSSSVTISMVSLEESIERFWKTEELLLNDGFSVEERHCEELYKSTTTRNEEGRYIVRLPRQPDFDVKLGVSKANTLRRFELLEKRFERDPKLKTDYHAFMKEYLDLGHMRLVGAHEKEPSVAYYLPHHPVFKDSSTTTKVRVVFDGSAKTSAGYSLNEALCVGPVVQDDLLDITVRFRTFKVAVVGDAAKMYRQVLLHPDDCSLVRIFFRFSPMSPIQIYELLTVTYGLAPSSFLATRTLIQLADDEGHAYPLGGPALRKNFYVDDFIGGAQSVEEAIRLRTELSELLAKGGFELRKWTSNQLEVLKGLRNDQIGTQSSLQFSPNETVKALGVCWEPEADTLRFDSNIEQTINPPTKRSILSCISRLFDPLGLIAPVVVKSKILMQELWLLSCGWDDPVPESIRLKWENICSELPSISTYRVDRYAFLQNATVQLHTFADASDVAYGACIYARCEDNQGNVRISLLASKSRVAPLKRISTPRLVQDDLLDITVRFRTFKVAVVGDAAKMYRQVLLHPDDCSLVRIFFRFSPMSPIQIYELLTVTYGLAPSSFLATRTLIQLADDEGHAYPLGGPALRKNFYVDDFIGGAQSVEEAIRLRTELSELLAKGGFELRKWTSNQLEVLKGLRNDQIGTQSSLQFSPNETVKALGVCWEPEADTLRFDSNIEQTINPPTKRSILSCISRLFDPLGLIAPVVVKSKILMQELWLLSCGWDDPVPESIRLKWENICSELPSISTYRVDRYAFLQNATVQLHTFADASDVAYGACIYARCEDNQGNVRISLLASKSRVAPLKRISTPRLELCAAVLGAHLHDRIKKAINIDISISFFWSDSAITLQWLRSPPNTWKTYVANRVSEIQHFTHGCAWNHVAGCENPADLVSRGMSAADFIESKLWRCGPDWLAHPMQDWPSSNPTDTPEADLEVRTVVSAVTTAPSVNPWFLRWSSYTRLLHVVAYCLRFVRNAREKARTQRPDVSNPIAIFLSPEQLERAKTLLIRFAQHDAFASEIRALEEEQALGKRSPLRKLSPFLDPERVMRVGGRLNLSLLPYQAKHPALLPKLHPFTRLIAEHHHKKLLHGGGRTLLSTIREEFWPIDGRRLVRSIVRNCFRCCRLNPVPAQQQIGQLPASRVVPSRPFSVVGVDYAGPFYLKAIHKRAAPTKAYLSLFVCFSTKAVHLELVSELSTSAFLAALRRFISRRGRPTNIHSDNGKNFEGAKNELVELFSMLSDEQETSLIHSFCASEGITWHLTPPKAPHFGGLWESAVKVAKKHLYRQIGSSKLSYEDMSTILAQIEAIMNSRPLLPLTEDPNDLAALTPAHFLVGTSMLTLPDPDLRSVPTSQLDQYWKLQSYIQRFWHHWQSEYLQELQKDTKGYFKNEDILPGKLVIVVDEQQPTTRWPLARIVELHPGKDQVTRVVSLRTAKGIVKRPITKVCILPFAPTIPDPEGEEIQPPISEIQHVNEPPVPAGDII